MKTLIIYSSKHDTTKKISKKIGTQLRSEVDIIDINQLDDELDLKRYDKVIIGSSIYYGSINKKLKKFISKNKKVLMSKNLGLFLCCINTSKEKLDEEFRKNYSEELRDHSIKNSIFGGEIIFDKLSPFEKFITKKVSGYDNDMLVLLDKEIEEFIETFKKD